MIHFPYNHSERPLFILNLRQALVLYASLLTLTGCACEDEPPVAPLVPAIEAPAEQVQAPAVEPTVEVVPEEPTVAEFTLERPTLSPHLGPWIWVKRTSAGIYAEPAAKNTKKLAYVKQGGKVPILKDKVKGKNCSTGWYAVRSGGYICSAVGTTDPEAPGAKFAPKQPDIKAVLPYSYVRNAKNGTPVYQSTPNKSQILEYEPWLPEAVKKREEDQAHREKVRKQRAEDLRQMKEAGLSVGGAPGNPELDEEVEDPNALAPIWTREDDLNQVTLEQLREGADGILAGRLMKGFYVAVNKEFDWADRKYFRTTKSVITPADRYWKTTASKFQGIELDEETWTLPIAWVVGSRKTAPLYEIDQEKKAVKPKGVVKKFTPILMSGGHFKIGRKDYYETKEGLWLRDPHIKRTTPDKRPEGVGESERWLDVDISEQTVVAFVGDRPVYATLISSGRFSKDEERDHSTPRGMWRVRVKHIVSTMDGNGTAAGDMSYSIEDVPYIMYFHKSYATHAAFWHRNYGYQMSHGCVNLAPLDAKWLFFFADPIVPEGTHGVWSSEASPGSWVVVHD